MTTSHTTDGTGYFQAAFADDNGQYGQGWTNIDRQRVPVMKIIQGGLSPDFSQPPRTKSDCRFSRIADSPMARASTVVVDETNIIAGALHPSGETAFFAQTGSSDGHQSGAGLVSFAVQDESTTVRSIDNEWFTSAAMDPSGEVLLLGPHPSGKKCLKECC